MSLSGDLNGLHLKGHYDSDSDDLLEEFYKPVLNRSIQYNRAVGYFSDAVLRSCALELANFIENGGTIKLVIGTFVSEAELSSIDPVSVSNEERLIIKTRLIASLKRLATTSIESVAIIGRLIDSGIAEIRVATRTKGIYHEKYGVFKDATSNRVAFIGSANETSSALGAQINHESISVYTTKDSYIYEKYGLELEERFENLWSGNLKHTRIHKIDDEVLQMLKKITKSYAKNDQVKPFFHSEQLPSIPAISGLRHYQEEALERWGKNKYKGVLAMATGTGKTLTAIQALKKFRENIPAGFIFIVVPYQNLAVQWIQAIQGAGIYSIPAFESKENWFSQFQNACMAAGLSKTDAPCVVAVEDTFKSDLFQELLNSLAQASEKNHFLIADECHHFNSPKQLKFLPSFIKYRLGLSATPYDQFSEKYLDTYFEGIIYEYSLRQAIDADFLCPYEYYVIETSLDEEETLEYDAITKKIVQVIGSEEKLTPENLFKVQPLLLRRARIVGSAKDKMIKLGELISASGKQQYSLVYCGDGSNEDEDGLKARQIDQATELLHSYHWKVSRITADEPLSERESLIAALKDKLIDAIVSIKVLDEGIDIPSCRVAYLLASQRSERQHIQRRGRILRKSPGKAKAVIYDFVVLGSPSGLSPNAALVKRELERVWRFATDALNRDEIFNSYKVLAEQVGLIEGDSNES